MTVSKAQYKQVLFSGIYLCLISCSNLRSYVRYSDLHEGPYIELKVVDNETGLLKTHCSKWTNDEEAVSYADIPLSDTNFMFLEGKRVIKYYDSYFIRKSLKNQRILKTYYNRDINF